MADRGTGSHTRRGIVPDYRFRKSDRLLKRFEFTEIIASGRTLHSDCFLAGIKTGRAEKIRLGITVSKKVGKATRRSRIKRHIREYFRLHRHRLSGSWDINVIAKKKAAAAAPEDLRVSLEALFNKSSKVFPSNR
ncbi:MAG: ribonuclease P protein component [Thermodesulfobacteriota bacterium]